MLQLQLNNQLFKLFFLLQHPSCHLAPLHFSLAIAFPICCWLHFLTAFIVCQFLAPETSEAFHPRTLPLYHCVLYHTMPFRDALFSSNPALTLHFSPSRCQLVGLHGKKLCSSKLFVTKWNYKLTRFQRSNI